MMADAETIMFDQIYPVDGSSPYSETLGQTVERYVGTFMKPAYLEFSEVVSKRPIEWTVGDYVKYSKTGQIYRLKRIPARTKQAKTARYGAAFVYENVQFFDGSKDLEMPFLDLVPYDNLIHYSTLNSVAFTGKPENVAERVEACMNYWYPGNHWHVSVIGGLGDSEEDVELKKILDTEVDFSVSGASCQEVLEKVYDIWGLAFSYSESGDEHYIVIGGPNKRTDNNTTEVYKYGKGIVRIKASAGNADQIATRLYVYGSMKNMIGGYYNGLDIKDAESVDIEHLMLPVSTWGETDGLPDARKAYLESENGTTEFGLIPRYAYFDGSDSNYPEIFPSIEGRTIGDVRAGKEELGETTFVPSSDYPNSQRIDEIVEANNPLDKGVAAPDGKNFVQEIDAETAEHVMVSPTSSRGRVFRVYEYTFYDEPITFDGSGEFFFMPQISGFAREEMLDYKVYGGTISLVVGVEDANGETHETRVDQPLPTVKDNDGIDHVEYHDQVYPFTVPTSAAVGSDEVAVRLYAKAVLSLNTAVEPSITVTFNVGSLFIGTKYKLSKTFEITIPQIGFNINYQGELGDGKKISMKSGMCAGRDFWIKDATYDPETDSWKLTCNRSKDDDLGMSFPNTDFPIAAGDRYVLLDIAMPELYITMAEHRLQEEGEKLLASIDHEEMFYEPEVNSGWVYNNNEPRILREGMYMHLVTDYVPIEDPDYNPVHDYTNYKEHIIQDEEDYAIIDSLEIDERASNIPVYTVKLRKKKAVGWSETISAGSSSKSSSKVQDVTSPTASSSSSGVEDSIWEIRKTEDGEEYAWLKDRYIGAAAGGFLSAMGLSTASGVSIRALDDIGDVDVPSPEDGQVLTWDSDSQRWIAATPESGGGGGGGVTSLYALSEVLSSTSPSTNDLFYFNGSKWTNLPKATLLSGYALTSSVPKKLSDLTDDVVAGHYQPLDPDLTAISGLSGAGFLKRASNGTWSLDDIENYFELSTVSGKTYVKVKDQYAGLYANGSISALGLSVTSGGSGGGASELNDLDDVTLSPTLSGDDVFMYINGIWTNVPKSTLLSGYALVTSIPTDTNDLTNGAGFVTSQYVSSNYQPLDSDLTGIAGLTGNGFLKRAANGTWSLENIDYFELSTVGGKTYVKVKDEYAGLYANGSISALGLSSTSGGGGASELNDLNDVTIASASSNDFLVYSNGEWRNMSKSAVLAGYVTTSDISGLATETYVNQRFEQLIGAAPEALDTLEEIASALQDSEDTVAGLVTSIAGKADKTELLKTITVKTGYKTTITCTVDGTTVALPDYPDSLTDLFNDLSYLRIYNGSEMLVQYRGESSASLNLADYIADVPTKTSELENDSGFYVLPSTGIPKTDLASGVQSSLGFADTAYQKPTGGIPKSDLASAVRTSLGKADTALQSYTETDPTVPAWAKASSLAFSSLPSIYIGKTAAQSTSAIQSLTGIGNINPGTTGTYDLGSSQLHWDEIYVDNIKLGSGTPYLYWDSTNNCWHLTGNFAADGWVSAMGVSNT